MDYSNNFFKPDKIDLAFVVFLLFIMLCNVTFCSVFEDVETTYVSGLVIAQSGNFFRSSPSGNLSYFSLEKGYIYHITSLNDNVNLAVSSNLPEVNVPYTYLYQLQSGETYDYISLTDEYLYFSWSYTGTTVSVTREKITDMEGTVKILSNDVGTNQFWNIFSFAIPFILVVLIFVFGFFFIKRLTKKESKGDIRF